jgi:hypothetical protein
MLRLGDLVTQPGNVIGLAAYDGQQGPATVIGRALEKRRVVAADPREPEVRGDCEHQGEDSACRTDHRQQVDGVSREVEMRHGTPVPGERLTVTAG